MTDTEFNQELKNFISDLLLIDRQVIKTEFYLNLQPESISFGGHFILSDNESIPIDIRLKGKYSNAVFVDKVESFHRQSTNEGINKWNKALFTIDNNGEIKHEFIWDEVWEQEEINAYKGQADL